MKDTLIVGLADMHSGNNYALFVDRLWRGKDEKSHVSSNKQLQIREHWRDCIENLREARAGKKLVVIHVGDAIDGVHHRGNDVCTHDWNDQRDIHLELMDEFKRGINWQAGDQLYYVLGTEIHTLNIEYEIAEKAGAQQLESGAYATSHLELSVHGKRFWFIHQGKEMGKGANEGNAIRNWLRDTYYDCQKEGQQMADAIYSAHGHVPGGSIWQANEGMSYRLIWGVVCPSWQLKTRYGYRVAPVERNKVGITMQTVTASGDIRPPVFWTRSISSAEFAAAKL